MLLVRRLNYLVSVGGIFSISGKPESLVLRILLLSGLALKLQFDLTYWISKSSVVWEGLDFNSILLSVSNVGGLGMVNLPGVLNNEGLPFGVGDVSYSLVNNDLDCL